MPAASISHSKLEKILRVTSSWLVMKATPKPSQYLTCEYKTLIVVITALGFHDSASATLLHERLSKLFRCI